MLGWDLVPQLKATHEVTAVDRDEGDITRLHDVEALFASSRPEVVVHCAAATQVDDCERDPDWAMRINGTGTRNIATCCVRHGVPVLYFSTDYVFDGEKPSPYLENDPPNPINAYGRSKLAGEESLRELMENYWIVRISWLFGPLGKNFIQAIQAKARQGESLRVVDDQVGAPTYTQDLATMTEKLVSNHHYGIYHITNQGYCSWFEFAREILHQEGLTCVQIQPISSAESSRPARRPRNSRLENRRLQSLGIPLLPRWQDALGRYLARAS